MLQSKNALTNLIARYKSVLSHCFALNTRTIACAALLGVSTCISFPVQGYAADLDVTTDTTIFTSDEDYDSATVTDASLTIDGGSLTVNGTFTNTYNADITFDNNGDPIAQSSEITTLTGQGTLSVASLVNEGYFQLDNGTFNVESIENKSGQAIKATCYWGTLTIGDSNTVINNSGYFATDVSSGNTLTLTASEWNNAEGSTAKIGGGTINVTTFNNSGFVQIHAWGSAEGAETIITIDTLNNTAGEFQLAAGTLNVTTFNNNGGTFTFTGGTLNTSSITNSSSFTMSGSTSLSLDTLYNTTNGTFNVSDATLTVKGDTTNYGTMTLTNAADVDFSANLTNAGTFSVYNENTSLDIAGNLTNGTSSATAQIYIADKASVTVLGSVTNTNGTISVYNTDTSFTVSGDFTNGSEATASTLIVGDGADITVGTTGSSNTFTNANGTVEVMNPGTTLTVNGDFINGTASTAGTLHIHDDDAVVTITGNLTNENGLIGVHSGTLTIEGVLINNSTSTVSDDDYHQDNEEAIHVHDATLIVSTLYLNAGGLGLYDDGTAELGSVYTLSGSEINVYGGGTFQAESGSIEGAFTIGNGYESTEDGTTTTVANGLLNKTSDGTLSLASLASSGDVTVNAGTLTINSGYNTGARSVFTIASGAAFTKTGTATDILTLSNSVINSGTMKVENGGLVITNLSNDDGTNDFTTNGDIIVTGQNSYLQLGDLSLVATTSLLEEGYATYSTLNETYTDVSMSQATVIFSSGVGLVLSNSSSLIVSNTTDTSTSTVTFDSGTLFKLDGHGFDRDNAAITVSGDEGSVDIASDANFLATNLTANTYYTLIANVNSSQDDIASTGWYTSVANGSLDRMIEGAEILYVEASDDTYGDSSTNDIVLVSGGVTDTNFGVDDEVFESMQDLWEAGENDEEADNAGTGFVSDAADKTEITSDAEAGKTLESALNVAVTGGVASMTADASDLASQAVNHRIDGVRAEAGEYYEDISATDWGIWAIPLYQQSQVRDMKIGVNSGGYDGYITGIIAGIDRKKDEWTFGFAFGAGVGEAESTGSYVDTSTQLDFWSAILYAGYHKGAFGLKADFTYTKTHSDINQANPYHLVSTADINAEVNSQLYSLGATASYIIEGEDVDITPHVGVRYRSYQQDSFTSTLGGRDLFTTHAGQMDTLLLPIGVTFSDDFLYNEWLITPRVDLSFTAVFGDTTIMNNVGIAGSGADVDAFGTVSIEADVLDNGFASLSIGCGAKKDNWSLGLDFDFQKSQRRDAQAVFARVAYRF